ncbi:MAG: hypothetical protein NTU98_15005 [Bacteroidetes bacterium]|nr:hypothetical protein [Bacteroidota bacterium]
MKTLLSFLLIMVCLAPESFSQVDKTQMGLDASKKYNENLGKLTQMQWKRKMEGFVDGNLAMSSVSSMTLGSDGKLSAIVITQQSYVEKKRGLRGKVQKSVVSDVNEYVRNAVNLVGNYIILSQGQFVDLFSKGTLTESGNTLQADAANILKQGDRLIYKFDKTLLLYQSQDISTVLGEDPVKANVNYETVNGTNRVTSVNIDLPGPKVKVKLTNFEYAKKQ